MRYHLTHVLPLVSYATTKKTIPIRADYIPYEQHPDLKPTDVSQPNSELFSEEIFSCEVFPTTLESNNKIVSQEVSQSKATARQSETIHDQKNDPSHVSTTPTCTSAPPDSSKTAAMLPSTSAALPDNASSSPSPSAGVSEELTEGKYTIKIKLEEDGKKIGSFITTVCKWSKKAILDEARSYCAKYANHHHPPANILWWFPDCFQYSLLSLHIDGSDIHLRNYCVDDLSFLVQTVKKSEIPTFTLSCSLKQSDTAHLDLDQV